MNYALSFITTALVATAIPAQAATLFKAAPLSGANETVPNASTATGGGTLLLSDDMNTINVFLSWAGLTGPATGGHVHCCALPGANGPVAIDFGPAAAATGSLTRVYDLTLASTYGNTFRTANGGTGASARTAFLAGLMSGRAYYNVHSARFPGGEIRGQLGPVPETATWGMMITGFGIVGGALRLQKRRTVVA